METFSALLAICVGNSPVPSEFPSQRPATRSFDIFFDLHLNKRLSRQSRRWWFETPSRPLWRHCYILPKVMGSWAMRDGADALCGEMVILGNLDYIGVISVNIDLTPLTWTLLILRRPCLCLHPLLVADSLTRSVTGSDAVLSQQSLHTSYTGQYKPGLTAIYRMRWASAGTMISQWQDI